MIQLLPTSSKAHHPSDLASHPQERTGRESMQRRPVYKMTRRFQKPRDKKGNTDYAPN